MINLEFHKLEITSKKKSNYSKSNGSLKNQEMEIESDGSSDCKRERANTMSTVDEGKNV